MAVLHAAFEAGVTFLDTSDTYCLDENEIGHNERLIAGALASWTGDRSRVVVATKGGLTRPQGNWVPDGRAKHLIEACEASLRALGVERIDLYQLHAPDPRTPLATTIRALDALKRDGRVERVGLCNVTVGQIEDARRITEIAAVQVELSIWDDGAILSGVAVVLREARHSADRTQASWRNQEAPADTRRSDAQRDRDASSLVALRDRPGVARRSIALVPPDSGSDPRRDRSIGRSRSNDRLVQ